MSRITPVDPTTAEGAGVDAAARAGARRVTASETHPQAIVETAAQVALSTFADLTNRASRTELDVPRVEAGV